MNAMSFASAMRDWIGLAFRIRITAAERVAVDHAEDRDADQQFDETETVVGAPLRHRVRLDRHRSSPLPGLGGCGRPGP